MPWCACCPASWESLNRGDEESFEDGLLEHPHYTKPRIWEGLEIPQILLSGDHKAIAKWKHEQREALTKAAPARPLAEISAR